MLGRTLRGVVAAVLAVATTFSGLIVGFLAAAVIGGWLPGPPLQTAAPPTHSAQAERTVLILEGLLHTDILLPADPDVRARFAFLRDSPVPLDHPDLRWLSFGWGSRAFYTTAGTYADIRPAAVWRAATGDDAVMRVVALPTIETTALRQVTLGPAAFERLLAHIYDTFMADPGGRPFRIDATIGANDAFYAAHGRFSLVNPCNEWTRRALRAAGVRAGRWTPTTHALGLALDRHGAQLSARQP